MSSANEPVRIRRDGVACSDLGDEVVLLDLETSTYFSATKVAARLVQWLQAGDSSAALVDRLVATYGVARDVAETDVAAFLDQLTARNLLEPVR